VAFPTVSSKGTTYNTGGTNTDPFVIDLPDLGGKKRLEKLGHKVFALCEFEGD